MRTLLIYLLKLVLVIALTGLTPVFGKAKEKPIVFKANSGETTDAFEGHFFVLENRNNPASRKIRINYVRFPATGSKSGNPIVYLSGGPGGSGIGTAKWRRFPMFMAMRQFGDVIALDQRGTGASEQAEHCEAEQQLPENTDIKAQDYLAIFKAGAAFCLSHWQAQGIDIYGYNTVQNALDINDLRVHLGADKVTLWGISYGTHLALTAVKTFPQYIDKLVLASAEGLDQTVKLPARTDAYLSRVQDVINQQALGKQIPDLKGLMHRVHQKASNTPFEIALTKQDGSTTTVFISDDALKRIAGYMVADPGPNLAMLIQLYFTLDIGVTDMLTGILQQVGYADDSISFRLMPLAMDVASGITAARLDKVMTQAQHATLGLALNFPMPQLLGLDNALDLGDDFRRAPIASIPTLLFSGTLDGRTYVQSQTEAVAGLKNLHHIIVENAGHNLFMSNPEVQVRINQFLSGSKPDTSSIQLPLPDLTLSPPGRR